MDIFIHGNVMPWVIDPAYLLELLEMSMIAVLVLTISGLLYAMLHSLLSNRGEFHSSSTKRAKSTEWVVDTDRHMIWSLPSIHNIQENE